jgi:uncharacterized protein YegL
MSSLLDVAPVPRRVMTLFFIVDTSGSMGGNKIGALNQAIREVLPMLDDISKNNADAEIKLAILEFSSGARWLYETPKSTSDFIFQDFKENGMTDLGQAYQALNEKLSRKDGAFMTETTGSYAPALLLMSDGAPTDNWESPLKTLKENNWFKSAIKVAIAIGDDADKEVLKEFTGNIEAVIETHNVNALKTIIRTVSVTASQIGSTSSTVGNKSKQDAVVAAVTSVVEDTDGAASAAAPATTPMDDDWD